MHPPPVKGKNTSETSVKELRVRLHSQLSRSVSVSTHSHAPSPRPESEPNTPHAVIPSLLHVVCALFTRASALRWGFTTDGPEPGVLDDCVGGTHCISTITLGDVQGIHPVGFTGSFGTVPSTQMYPHGSLSPTCVNDYWRRGNVMKTLTLAGNCVRCAQGTYRSRRTC